MTARHSVSNLDGELLDAAVAVALGTATSLFRDEHGSLLMCWNFIGREDLPGPPTKPSHYSVDWGLSGPIIERENISLSPPTSRVHRHGGPNAGWGLSGYWSACTWHRGVNGSRSITTHETSALVAAMRCFVESKLGEEVELP